MGNPRAKVVMTNSKSIPFICLVLIVAAGATNSSSASSNASTSGNASIPTPTPTPSASASAAAENSTASASTTASTSTSTVTQKYTFTLLTAAAYTGDTKGNIECAYTCTVENGGVGTCTWCVAQTTSPYRVYKSGVAITSSAARRAATVTFVLVVGSSVKSLAQLQTLVASNSDATKFATALTAVNTGTGLNITDPGTATVATATFTSTGSSASTLLPSMLTFVSALLVAFRK